MHACVRRRIEASNPDAITGEASSNTYTSAMGVYLRRAGLLRACAHACARVCACACEARFTCDVRACATRPLLLALPCRGSSSNRATNVTMPQLLREASPWLRSIVLFREPADRYASAYYYYGWVAVVVVVVVW